MKNCSIVIGSFWGDEGKGHMTDILCSKDSNSLNVRFNGGAQASHTVVTPDGKRHAFRHFGAGTFAGAKTYLSKEFMVNPIAFELERKKFIDEFQIVPEVYVHPFCAVTTLWDIYINQAVEVLRGDGRHGSCGMGINETLIRSRNERYCIKVKDLIFKTSLRDKLLLIKDEYVAMRLKSEYHLTIDDLPEKYQELLKSDENVDMFLFYAEEFVKSIKPEGYGILGKYTNVVFEGAQGLLLDQNNKEYRPHLTSSNTGIKNVMHILDELSWKGNVDIYYMSRCYITRHGAGPFEHELGKKPYENVVDLTNIPNEFQGALRFGYLDFDLLVKEINKDLKNLKVQANIHIVFTCLDQVDDVVIYYENGKLKEVAKSEFLQIAWKILSEKIEMLYSIDVTNGLTRENFLSFSKEAVAYV